MSLGIKGDTWLFGGFVVLCTYIMSLFTGGHPSY